MRISPRPSACCWASRRAFARTSSTDRSDESSMNSGDSASRLEACEDLRPSASAGTLPLRRSSPLIEACEAMKRCASSDSDISSENSATAFLLVERRVLGEVGHQRRLAHRRAGGEDDQVAGLEAAGDRVEVLEAGRRAGDRLALARRAARACRARRRAGRGSRGSPCGGPRGRPRGSRARRCRRARAAAPRGECTRAWIS